MIQKFNPAQVTQVVIHEPKLCKDFKYVDIKEKRGFFGLKIIPAYKGYIYDYGLGPEKIATEKDFDKYASYEKDGEGNGLFNIPEVVICLSDKSNIRKHFKTMEDLEKWVEDVFGRSEIKLVRI